MSDRFQACLAETLKWEGGYSNHPKDPGGPTMKGIIQREYDAYRRRKGVPARSVRQIEQSELEEIYRDNYWVPVRGDELPAGIDLEVFDFAVNSGPVRSISKLQACLGLPEDGHIGPRTMDSVLAHDTPEFISRYMGARLKFLQGLRTWHYFGKGWSDRCKGVEATARTMAGQLPMVAAAPKADPDQQGSSFAKTPREDAVPLNPMVPTAATGAVAGVMEAARSATDPIAVVTPTPDPQSWLTQVEAMGGAAHTLREFGTFAFEQWPWVAAAVCGWGLLTYGLPRLHKWSLT